MLVLDNSGCEAIARVQQFEDFPGQMSTLLACMHLGISRKQFRHRGVVRQDEF